MALFSKTKKQEPKKKVSSSKSSGKSSPSKSSSALLLSRPRTLLPRITEKGTVQAEQGVYVFTVDRDATKTEIAALVELFYKVRPVKVATVQIRGKKMFRRGIRGKSASGKKAYVFLKKGESITFA